MITTDGFLLPNAELERRGILDRKGFPESYDQRALLRFVSEVKSGATDVKAPVYSHLSYDIVPGEWAVVERPDVLIVEGLNVLQPARTRADGSAGLAVSDFFDFSIYVDAKTAHVQQWYVDRFLALRETAFADPASFFHRFAVLSDDEAVELATGIWKSINEVNLRENILPTRGRATLVLRKAARPLRPAHPPPQAVGRCLEPTLPDWYELDDDPSRFDLDAAWDLLDRYAYWGRFRTRDAFERQVARSWRVLAAYHNGRLVGFARAVADGETLGYLADVVVAPEHRGRGIGRALARGLVEDGPAAGWRWMLHTRDAPRPLRRPRVRAGRRQLPGAPAARGG